MLVHVEVSSINTSRDGSNMPCSRIQRRRTRASSARFCSAARRLFLKPMPWRSKNRSPPARRSEPATIPHADRAERRCRRLALLQSFQSPPSAASKGRPHWHLSHSVRPLRAVTHRPRLLRSRGHASPGNKASALDTPDIESMSLDSLIDKPLGILPIRSERNTL
jgi:hypothetical protein